MDDHDDNKILQEDLTSPDFILRNLKIAKDIITDSTRQLEARVEINEIFYNQLIYYLYMAITCFVVTKEAPTILVYGTGTIGNNILIKLMDLGLTDYLRVFSRGDEGSNYWKSKGLQASSSLEKIFVRPKKCDIVILASPLTSFPAISKHLSIFMDNKTFVISCTFGLQRKRIFCNLNFPSIMRTFVEPDLILKRIKATYKKRELDEAERARLEDLADGEISTQVGEISPPEPPNLEGNKPRSRPDTSDATDKKPATPLADDSAEFEYEEESEENSNVIDDEVSDYDLGDHDFNLDPIEYAADLIASRVHDIRLMLYVIENFYSLRGMPHPVARFHALKSVVGYEDTEFYPYELEKQTELEMLLLEVSTRSSFVDTTRIGDIVNIRAKEADPAVDKLRHFLHVFKNRVVGQMHRYLSRYIRVVDLPKVSAVIRKINHLKATSPDLTKHILDAVIAAVTPKPADEDDESDEIKFSEEPLTIGMDLAFQPMHSHDTFLKLYDQDRKIKAPKRSKEADLDEDGESLVSDVTGIIGDEFEPTQTASAES